MVGAGDFATRNAPPTVKRNNLWLKLYRPICLKTYDPKPYDLKTYDLETYDLETYRPKKPLNLLAFKPETEWWWYIENEWAELISAHSFHLLLGENSYLFLIRLIILHPQYGWEPARGYGGW